MVTKKEFEEFKDEQFRIFLKKVNELSKKDEYIKKLLNTIEILEEENIKHKKEIKNLNKYISNCTDSHPLSG